MTHILQDNLSVAAIFLDESVNLDVFACELPHIADIAQVIAKYDNAESTCLLVFAEVKDEVSGRQWTYAQDLSGDAGFRSDLVGGLRDREALC